MPHAHSWVCPTGCFAASPFTKAPYCLNDYNEACRAKAPVVCNFKETGTGCKLETKQAVEAAEELDVAELEGITATDMSATASDIIKGA
jgi:hypothetical protein